MMPMVDSTDAQLARARELWQQNDVAGAEAALRRLHACAPARADASMLLAEVLRGQGRLDAACKMAFEACSAGSFAPELSVNAATFARQCDRHAVAMRICDMALSRQDPPVPLLVLAGHVARELGDFDGARRHYLAALGAGADLERDHLLGALVNTRRYTDPHDPDLSLCERHFRDTAYSARSRASAGFGLAKIQGDLGDCAAAAQTLRAANALVHAVRPWSAAAWRHWIQARGVERAVVAEGGGIPGFRPLFVVGMPRTGTTLTARLLSQCTTARDRGELRFLHYVSERLIAGGHLCDRAVVAEAARLYAAQSRQDDAPAPCYIDQDPLNFRYLHIAAAMFPTARVIHCRRDRRDTALSLWCQDFAHQDYAFAYDFQDIGEFQAGQDALMKRWRDSLPVPVYELDYEALVADTNHALASLRAFIDVPLADATAAPPEAPVQSASVWQARQPVYSSSVGRWRAYAPWVPELACMEA